MAEQAEGRGAEVDPEFDEDDYEEDHPQRARLQTLIANSETSQKVYKTGFLNKTGGGNRRKNWKRRFFLLSETALAYFTDDNSRPGTVLKGGVLLANVLEVREALPAEAMRPYMFVIVTSSRNYCIQAPTDFERTDWITAMTQLMANQKKKRPSHTSGGSPESKNIPDTSVRIMYHKLRGRSIRGRPERLRLLLAEIGVPFVNEYPSDWPALKAELLAEGLQGTLPLVTLHDGSRTTQNVAVIRHFARVHQRYGTNQQEALRCDMVADTIEDWRIEFDRVAYYPGFLKDNRAVQSYAKDVLPMRLKLFETMLSSRDMEYFVGSRGPTFADLMVFDCLDSHLQIDSAVLDGFPRLRDFVALIRELPRIAEYISSRGPSDFEGKETSLSPDIGSGTL